MTFFPLCDTFLLLFWTKIVHFLILYDLSNYFMFNIYLYYLPLQFIVKIIVTKHLESVGKKGTLMDDFFGLALVWWLQWEHTSTEPSQIDTTSNPPFKNGRFLPVFHASVCVCIEHAGKFFTISVNEIRVCKPWHRFLAVRLIWFKVGATGTV